MSHARQPRDGHRAGGRSAADDGPSLTTKVVLIELVEAGGPLSAADLEERTLLAEPAVRSALEVLADRDLCTELPADDRRPARYVAEMPGSTAR